VAYFLGIDVGTTWTAAAVWRDGRNDMVGLGNRAQAIPTVVLLRDDETVLVGEPAARRAASEPLRVAREFKRRLGDPTPIIVGGTPYSADALIARVLRWVVDRVSEVEGGPPDRIAVTHPANWGQFKLDLLRQACRLADLDRVLTLSEPEAAAINYAALSRVEPGAVIAVYDLGGGTFDAAVLRKREAGGGWQLLASPEGIERLGGIDFDEAVFRHVSVAVGGAIEALDETDPAAQAAVTRLRQECVEAKEALSTDTDVSIPVLLPTLQTEVRLTRAEYEQMVRPALGDTMAALSRALRAAGVGPADVSAVLLVGGSSRTPLVAEMVTATLGRPVAVDAHPKHGVALGAAILAASTASPAPVAPPVAPPPVAAQIPAAEVVGHQPLLPPERVDPPPPPAPTGAGGGSRRGLAVVGAVVGVLVLAAAGTAMALAGGDDDGGGSGETSGTTPGTEPATTPPATTGTTVPAGPFVQIDDIVLDGGRYRVDYQVFGYEPEVDGGPDSLHVHFFLDTTAPEDAGSNSDSPGDWDLTDQPSFLTKFGPATRGDAAQMCAGVATVDHGVYDLDTPTGNCAPLPT
jgi:actin-like ATPase involved in cell morphogenesis